MKKIYNSGSFNCMVAIGDSVTVGYSATRQEYSWVSRLGRLLSEFQDEPVRVINNGISANVISPNSRAYQESDKPSGLERYKRDIISFNPDLVIISYGLNDMRCGTPIDVFMADMDIMVREIQEKSQALIVIVGVYYQPSYVIDDKSGVWNYGNKQTTKMYNTRMRRYAESGGSLYSDVYSAQSETNWSVDKDGVHPNNLGHALIAHKVFETIATHCRGLSIKSFRDAEDYPRWGGLFELPLRNYDNIEDIRKQ